MSMKEAILAAAEKRARVGGYAGFSFRDLATDVGIKSASIHYHFNTKEALGAELAKMYAAQFFEGLGSPSEIKAAGRNPIEIYVDHFSRAFREDEAMCLCGLLGAEAASLPHPIRDEVNLFFNRNVSWLEEAYREIESCGTTIANRKATGALAMLEGALLLSTSLGSEEPLEKVTSLLSSEWS